MACLLPRETAAQDNDPPRLEWGAYLKQEMAYRLASPPVATKIKTIGFLSAKYRLGEKVGVRIAGRGSYDAVYDLTNGFPQEVGRDQEAEASLREALLHMSLGKLDARVGLQQIVWGEALGTFIADVVNPKDLREFLLQDFREVRIPLWAMDLTCYCGKGLVLEGVWTPRPGFNRLPKPGAEFAYLRPTPPAQVKVTTEPTSEPATALKNSEAGLRISWVTGGQDLGLFYLYTFEASPIAFARSGFDPPTSRPTLTFAPRHPRVHFLGATLAKTMEPVVLRSEFVLTFDKWLRMDQPRDPFFTRKTVLNYMVGLDYTAFHRLAIGVQFLQHVVPGGAGLRDEQQREGKVATGFSVRLATDLLEKRLSPELLVMLNADRRDHRVSPRITYAFNGSLKVAVGADMFGGPRDTLYGQFAANGRFYGELRYGF